MAQNPGQIRQSPDRMAFTETDSSGARFPLTDAKYGQKRLNPAICAKKGTTLTDSCHILPEN